jgi:hypothetical protein
MHPILVRILKQGIPVALILAAVGFVLAEAAGMWFAMQSGGDSTVRVTVGDATVPADPSSGGNDLTRALRTRMPFTMAAWGFGIVAVIELLLGLWRGRKPMAPVVPAEVEIEKLLQQHLQKAEAANADRARSATDTPPPGSSCPAPSASENSPVNN